jgi:hypothetical protein
VTSTDSAAASDTSVADDAATADADDDTSTPGEDVGGGTNDSTSSGNDTLAADSPSDVAMLPPFPAGPYGNTVGSVMANLAWEGHVTDLAETIATTKPYVTTSMDALRRKAPKGYAMVHVSEFF